MSEQFKVGDICVGQNFIEETIYNEMECEIIGGLQTRTWYDSTGNGGEEMLYDVRWANGSESYQPPFNLRRKRLPRRECDEVVRWDDCAWKPKHKEAA